MHTPRFVYRVFSFQKVGGGPETVNSATPFKPPGSSLQFNKPGCSQVPLRPSKGTTAVLHSDHCGRGGGGEGARGTLNLKTVQSSVAKSATMEHSHYSVSESRATDGTTATKGSVRQPHSITLPSGSNVSPPIAMVAPVVSSNTGYTTIIGPG